MNTKSKTGTQYIALLRGINVGGNNIIKMTDLKVRFESLGLKDVVTYIQSGNVLFYSNEQNKAKLTNQIEDGLSQNFNYKSKIALITASQLESVVKNAPNNFGQEPDEYRYDVLFLIEPLSPEQAMKSFKLREGVDNVYLGSDVLYFTRLISRAGQSYLTKVISLPVYQNMTIRNWNTTAKLYELMNR